MSRATYTTKQFIDAIENSGGIISNIAAKVGCSWATAQKHIKEYPTIAQAYEDECQRINDMAQSVLMKSIKDGNTQDAKWWLSKKRKAEFGESVDVTSGGEKLERVTIIEVVKSGGE
jgi:uncharacterized protein with ATP-grasp and redox domains